MIVFESNKDNDDYIMINVRAYLPKLLANRSYDFDISDDAYDDMNYIYKLSIFNEYFNKRDFNKGDYSEIAIKKDSLIGQFLIENTDNRIIRNKDLYISYEDVVNAFLISISEDNCKMSNKISKLFKNQESGLISEIIEKYQNDGIYDIASVTSYIKANSNFRNYLQMQNGTYNEKTYIVYEDKCLVEKKLVKNEKVMIKK